MLLHSGTSRYTRYRYFPYSTRMPQWGQAYPQLVELSKQGWCWWYRKYAQGHTVLEGLETDAREGRKGLWVDPQPVPPWKWRKRKER